VRFEELIIRDVRRETPDCVSIAFDVPDHLRQAFAFTQGQNVTVRARLGGDEVRRSYSICSSPAENELRIAVKQVPEGVFSTHANQLLKIGDRLEVLPPSGRFFTQLHPDAHKQYVAFAAGSGITPILSIIKTTLETEPGSQFTLVYGNKGRGSILFKETLEALKNRYIQRFRVIHILSREKTDIPLFQGRIDTGKCALLAGTLIDLDATDEFFICGPESMIFSVRDFLESRGVQSRKVHFELFTTPGQKTSAGTAVATAATGPTSHVHLRLDGLTFDFDLPYEGASILDAALAEGADLPFACKGGVCCTCRARLVSGEIVMDANYALEPDELAAGYILTCQAHPRSGEVSVDFDSK